MGGRGGSSMTGQMGHRHQRHSSLQLGSLGASAVPGVDTEDTALVGGAESVHNGHGRAGCGGGFLMNLLGFDRFTRGKAVNGLARAGKASNPFDLGLVGNCRDFWRKGRELGVEYEVLYDVPVEGFREAKRRREEEENAGGEGHASGSGRKRKSLFTMGMGFGLGRSGGSGSGSASASRAGYEPVSQTQV